MGDDKRKLADVSIKNLQLFRGLVKKNQKVELFGRKSLLANA